MSLVKHEDSYLKNLKTKSEGFANLMKCPRTMHVIKKKRIESKAEIRTFLLLADGSTAAVGVEDMAVLLASAAEPPRMLRSAGVGTGSRRFVRKGEFGLTVAEDCPVENAETLATLMSESRMVRLARASLAMGAMDLFLSQQMARRCLNRLDKIYQSKVMIQSTVDFRLVMGRLMGAGS